MRLETNERKIESEFEGGVESAFLTFMEMTKWVRTMATECDCEFYGGIILSLELEQINIAFDVITCIRFLMK